MSAGLLTVATFLGALAGWVAVPLAHRFTGPWPVPSAGPADGRGVRPLPDRVAGPASGRGVGRRPGERLGVSLVGAVVFGGLAAARGAAPELPALLLVGAVGLVLALVDLACLRLPDRLVALAAIAGGLGLTGAAPAAGAGRLLPALAGAATAFAGYVLLALLPGSRLGFGDVKLATALGLPLGWLGWPTLALGLLLPHLLNGVVVLALLAARKVRRDTALPLGPAILAGAWLAVLFA